MNLPQLPQDKANHAIYGALIFIVSFLFSHSAVIAGCIVVFFALAKEGSDALINYRTTGDPMHGPHGVEVFDALATCFGGILAGLPLVIQRLF
jgi:hypothetical protein